MYNNFKICAFALCAISLPLLSSCSDDDNDGPKGMVKVGEITFENTNIILAGPDSYGANLYADYTGGDRFTVGSIAFNKGANAITFGLNTQGDFYPDIATLYNGGMFLSQFNLRSNPADKTGDWWYSFNNQCSVYNVESVDGANRGAGDDNSNTFAVINGSCDASSISSVYGSGKEVSLGGFHFDNNAEFTIGEIEICNTSYVYGVIQNGNGLAQPLKANNGWFKVLAYGYDATGHMTAGSPVELYLCDYRAGSRTRNLDNDWEDWNLKALGNVNRVVFNFEGSDAGEYGLNTPGYLALDNIEIYTSVNK